MKKSVKAIIAIAVAAVILAAGFICYLNRGTIIKWAYDKFMSQEAQSSEPEINIEYIKKEINEKAQLETAEVTYGCMTDFIDGNIPVLTKKSFTMYYEVTAYAGIDMNAIEYQEDNGKIIIKLPPAEINIVDINEQTIEFYNVDKALFNWKNYSDITYLFAKAKEDARNQATSDELISLADNNAVKIITELLNQTDAKDKFEVQANSSNISNRKRVPVSHTDAEEMTATELKQAFENAGFTNITMNATEVSKFNLSKDDDEVVSVTVNGNEMFTKCNVYDADCPIVIEYYAKES